MVMEEEFMQSQRSTAREEPIKAADNTARAAGGERAVATDTEQMKLARQQLKERFGHSSLRPAQEKAIAAVLQGRDVFMVAATGAGKSLCFQLPAVVSKKPVVVISPLISLMEDQCDALNQKGIKACFLNGHQRNGDVWRDAKEGKYSLLYMAPERVPLWMHGLDALVRNVGVTCFAIDEAHCVSEW